MREKDSAWYDEVYRRKKTYKVNYAESCYYKLWWFVVSIFPPQKRNIVDLGCGPGQFAELLKDNGYENYVGVDFSEVAVQMAREKFTVQNGFEFIVGDLNNCDIPDGEIYCLIETLEHVRQDREILRRIPKDSFVVGFLN